MVACVVPPAPLSVQGVSPEEADPRHRAAGGRKIGAALLVPLPRRVNRDLHTVDVAELGVLVDAVFRRAPPSRILRARFFGGASPELPHFAAETV